MSGQGQKCEFSHFSTQSPWRTDGLTDGWTDQRTNRPTDKAYYRVVCPQLILRNANFWVPKEVKNFTRNVFPNLLLMCTATNVIFFVGWLASMFVSWLTCTTVAPFLRLSEIDYWLFLPNHTRLSTVVMRLCLWSLRACKVVFHARKDIKEGVNTRSRPFWDMNVLLFASGECDEFHTGTLSQYQKYGAEFSPSISVFPMKWKEYFLFSCGHATL